MEHPEMLVALMQQQRAQSLVDAERGRLARVSRQRPGTACRSLLALVLEVQLPWGRRVRFRVGRMARTLPF
jgi:hypothetical protein